MKGLSHIHGSHHRSSRILIRAVPARNTMVTVFLLRCTFFKFYKGAFTHSRIATRTIPGHCAGSSVLSPASPCRHRAGIRRDPWQTSISVKKFKPAQFSVPEYKDEQGNRQNVSRPLARIHSTNQHTHTNNQG